MTKIQ